MAHPIVSISIPFFEEPHIFATLASIKSQSLKNFICLINDDFSEIKFSHEIQKVISGDSRFIYTRSPSNQGGWANQKYCIDFHKNISNTKYSFELGHHDLISENYLESCINFLESHSDYSSCTGTMMGFVDSPATAEPRNRQNYDFFSSRGIEAFLLSVASLTDCTIYNSVYRTEILRLVPHIDAIETPMVRSDHHLISLRAAAGKTMVLDSTNYLRRDFIADTRKSFVERQSNSISTLQLNANFILGYIKLLEDLFIGKLNKDELLEARGLIFDCLLKRFAS